MDFRFTPEQESFRGEVRSFIKTEWPKAREGESFTRKLAAKGWLTMSWPVEHGGQGADHMRQLVYNEEMAYNRAPGQTMGTDRVGPTIILFGTDEQKKELLPRIIKDEITWCQGFSEPGSGSDLASLQTRAIRDGDHYIVNGQKTWTSFAHWGDWIFCLVRTNPDAKPQEGISFLLIDMKSPGVTVRPIIMTDGAHHVNDVFLDNVKVPVENLIGKENEGWTCAKFLLANERLGIAEVPASKRGVSVLRQIARLEPQDGGTLADDPAFTAQIADIDLQVQALEMSELRVLSTMAQGGAPGPEVSTLKVRGSEIQQRIAELTMEAVGEYAQPYQPGMLFHDTNETPIGPDHAPPAAPRYFNMRKTSIYGGSTEIQKNIVSKMVLGL